MKNKNSDFSESTPATSKTRDDNITKVYNRSKTIKIIALEIVIFALLIAGAFAWFSTNKEVGSSNMQMSSTDLGFELAVPARTETDEIYYNPQINSLGYSTTDSITTENGSIRWILRDESPKSSEEYNGFHPGSYGSATFYILPKTAVETVYTFQFNLTGYYAEFVPDSEDSEKLTKEIKENTFKTLEEMAAADSVEAGEKSVYEYASDYLKGHIIFFQNRQVLTAEELSGETDNNLYYSGRIIDSFSYDTSVHTSTTFDGHLAYEVTLYWIWPNTFSQILFDSSDEKLNDVALFSQKQGITPAPRTELKTYISENPSYYFSSTELTSKSSDELMTLMGDNSINTTNALITLSNGYNGADQIIGENVKFILAELTAVQE